MTTTQPSLDELADVIALHREMFAGYTMQADPPPPTDADTGAGANPTTDTTGDTDNGAAGGTTDWVAEARKWEKRAKDNAASAKRAADLEQQLQAIADKDKTETQKAADRAAKAEAERDTYAQQLAALRRETAVMRHASGIADPQALLDSRTFTDSIADVDPDDDKALKAAIEKAVKANPRLAPAPARTGGDTTKGHTATPTVNGVKGVARLADAFEQHLNT